MQRHKIETIISELEANGTLRQATLIRDSSEKGVFVFTGKVTVSGQQIGLGIMLLPTFPRSLPLIFLEDGSEFKELPHVLANKVICYHHSEGTILDEDRPSEIITWAIDKTVRVLADGKAGLNLGDFADEFESYWGLVSKEPIINLVNSVAKSQELKLFRNNQASYLAKSAQDVAGYLHLNLDEVAKKFPTVEQATLFVLPQGSQIIPPRSEDPFWTPDDLKRAVQPALNALSIKQQRQFIKVNNAKRGTMLFALPRPSGGYSLFCVTYDSPKGYHPFSEFGKNAKLCPLKVYREEASYVLPRGGGQSRLRSKKVLLIGCGSLGGHVAHELVRAGVMNVTAVDSDKMSLDNTFRHVLGNAYRDRPKATALSEELRRKFPYVHVTAFDKTIEELVESGHVRFDSFDLVISSLGSPTTEIWINRQLKSKTPGLFGWVEPLGIGGHALLTQPATSGCFRCLYSSEDEEDKLINRAAFAGKNQWFGKSLSGCGQLHTPYGSLDAVRTAALIVQLAIEHLTGKEQKSSLVSWKGDAADFLEQGFELADRFNVSTDKLVQARHAFATPVCPVCGNSANLT
ncbi:ThiF family adenylyltransferase [Fibrella forsythiae]|uniref:ThiF family adenylyltransferase n=1 Tax=Fibrella forsythiae TaxID=2817061 RepID=A0ABS3JPP2_9BACT|nr:ThiF family adenylyltransferase [Fibrella forsythiae]MBO0951179.1 ThiF family adenylyltransferase [Fibrella forsythiae]